MIFAKISRKKIGGNAMSIERLDGITLSNVDDSKQCTCCCVGGKKRMWHCHRYSKRGGHQSYYYCLGCMPTAEAVLHEIDSDNVPFGLVGIDEYGTGFKTDFTRLNAESSKQKKKKK